MRISDDEFDAAVAEALDDVPERFKAVLHNIAITVADEPTDRERGTMADPRGELLGLYQGVPLPQRTTGSSGVLPDIITIFKGPHERICGSRAQLVGQIRKTVLHEIGHYFGFDDDYLHAHGY